MALHRFLPLLGCTLALTGLARAAAPTEAPEKTEPATTPAPAAKVAQSAQQSPAPSSSSAASSLALLRQLDTAFTHLFNEMAPSVVVIETKKKGGSPSDSGDAFDFFFRSPDTDPNQRNLPLPDPSQLGEASGFILRADGVIATNNHVIDGADKITVRLKDGRRFPAKVLGIDERTDLAVIKIDAKELPVVRFAPSDEVRIGQLVFAIGVPFSLDYSFTVGVVSGKGRSRLSSIVTYEDYIQSDAFINPGNSGGPLFDVEGRVVGMNTLINGIGRGLSFAIPSAMIQDVSTQLINSGRVRYPWLGIRIETLEENSSLREQIQGIDKGVVINTIEPDTPAYKSDLRPADVITAIDGSPVESAQDLQKQVLTKKVGQKVTLTIWRGKRSLDITMTTGELPPPGPTTASTPSQPPSSPENTPSSGLTLQDIDAPTRERLKLENSQGALVIGIEPQSPAALADLKEDDVITEIDSHPVTNTADAHKLLQHNNKPLLIIVVRNGQKTYAVLKPEPGQ